MNKFLAVIIFVSMLMCLGCGDGGRDADADMQAKTAAAMKEANAQAGMPAIVNFQEKKLAKMIYELRDQERLVCYAYLKSLEGVPVYLGKCLGFGLPYCVQYSNPERLTRPRMGGNFYKMPQPEPNGLFMPSSLSATWLMMIDPKTGDARPVYVEPEVIVSPFPLESAMGGPVKQEEVEL